MLVTVLGLVNKLPVIGTVNRGLGWLTGGMTALLDLYLVLCVVWGLVVITGGNLNVLNDTVMHSSLYYKAFNVFNPFLYQGQMCIRDRRSTATPPVCPRQSWSICSRPRWCPALAARPAAMRSACRCPPPAALSLIHI